jgi:uncharacterized protein YdeI (YjbR/CyaY-like superfamily)
LVDLKLLHLSTRAQWRAWLARHYATDSHVWLVFYKRHTGKPRVEYSDSVEEALCFGWIDSIVRRLDEDRYAQKFTPRSDKSQWSALNRQRFARLVEKKLVTRAGFAKGPQTSPRRAAKRKRPDPPSSRSWDRVPPYIRQRLKQDERAWRFFATLAPSYRRMYVGWIHTAKREDTRMKRLEEAVQLLAKGKKLGLK